MKPAYQPGKRGFDEVFIHGAGGIGQTYPGSCGDAPNNSYFSPAILHNNKFEKTKGYCTDVFFDAGPQVDRRQTQAARRPSWPGSPPTLRTRRWICPEEYEKNYAGKVKPNVAKFFGMIANIDDNVGKLLAKIGGVESRKRHARHLHDRQRRHGRRDGLQRRHARHEGDALPGGHARAVLRVLEGQAQGRRRRRQAGRARGRLAHLRRPGRHQPGRPGRQGKGSATELSTGWPQLVAAAREQEC